MTEARDISEWICGLADPDPIKRTEFARELYRAGFRLCEGVLRQWETAPEFRSLLYSRGGDSGAGITVGIAVGAFVFDEIRAANGSPTLADVPPEQDAKEFELHFHQGTALDILTTREPGGSGAIARYLEKFREGIQQIEVNVTDVDRATDILRARFGLVPIYPASRPGADGTRVNFFLAPAAEGKKVLIELVETKAPQA
jgi:hypothetical protein